jgi:hypothetical protein
LALRFPETEAHKKIIMTIKRINPMSDPNVQSRNLIIFFIVR